MKVLVTGAAGYVGSHCVVELLAAGHEVVGFDSLVRGRREAVERAARIGGRPVPLEVGDLCDAATVRDVLARHRPQAVLHVAAYKSVAESVAHPERYERNNVHATQVLADALVWAGISRVVYASTGSVYGDVDSPAIPETSPVAPISPYARTKALGETILAGAGLDLVSLRFFNVCGAHPSGELGEYAETSGNLLPVLLEALRAEAPVARVFGDDYDTPDGTCVRDYVHVSDVAAANVAALAFGGRGTYNVGTGHGSTVLEVIRAVEAASGRRFRVVIEGRRAGDPQACVAAVGAARADLGFTARHTLADMVESALRWARR